MQKKSLLELENRRSSEIRELKRRYPDRTDRISTEDFEALTKKHPLPALPDENDGTIVDKVYDILLSVYEYMSAERIAGHPLCSGTNEKRIEGAVRKLLLDRRIISVTVGGEEYYAPSDFAGFVIG